MEESLKFAMKVEVNHLGETDPNVKLIMHEDEKWMPYQVQQPLIFSPQPFSMTEFDFEDCDNVPYFSLRVSSMSRETPKI